MFKSAKSFAESYFAPTGWYGCDYTLKMTMMVATAVLESMIEYYGYCLSKCPDVITVSEVSWLTDYRRSIIGNWCKNGHLEAFMCYSAYHIPIIYPIDFSCSEYVRYVYSAGRLLPIQSSDTNAGKAV